jgi:hypothetical protein
MFLPINCSRVYDKKVDVIHCNSPEPESTYFQCDDRAYWIQRLFLPLILKKYQHNPYELGYSSKEPTQSLCVQHWACVFNTEPMCSTLSLCVQHWAYVFNMFKTKYWKNTDVILEVNHKLSTQLHATQKNVLRLPMVNITFPNDR